MKSILYNWNMMRLLRLVMGIIAVWQAITIRDWMLGIFGVIIVLMALANIGCCGVNGCSINPYHKPVNAKPEKVGYEEVVNK